MGFVCVLDEACYCVVHHAFVVDRYRQMWACDDWIGGGDIRTQGSLPCVRACRMTLSFGLPPPTGPVVSVSYASRGAVQYRYLGRRRCC